jgi:hypothetical protein
MLPVGFEPTIPAGERPQTHALERAATGISLVQLKYTTFMLNCMTPTVWPIGVVTRSLHGRLRNCASIPGRDRLISIPEIVKRGFHVQFYVRRGSGPLSYSGVTGGTFFGDKGAGASSWPLLHLVPNLRTCEAIPPLPTCFHGLMLSQKNNSTFLLYDIDHCYVVVRIFVLVTLKVEVL